MLPQEMLQNRSSVHSHMISWRTDRCQRWSRKLCHIDIIKAYDGNILRNTDPVFGKGFDRTKSDRIACCKDRRRQLATVDQIACHLITGRNPEDTLLDIRLINQIVCITVINKDFFSVIRIEMIFADIFFSGKETNLPVPDPSQIIQSFCNCFAEIRIIVEIRSSFTGISRNRMHEFISYR